MIDFKGSPEIMHSCNMPVIRCAVGTRDKVVFIRSYRSDGMLLSDAFPSVSVYGRQFVCVCVCV